MALTDYQGLVDDLVRDDSGKIKAADRDEAIARAVERYSSDRPLTAVEDLPSGAGGHILALPTGWQADFSKLGCLEYPIGEIPPRYIEQGCFWLYQAPAGFEVQLRNALPAGVNVRASFTQRRVLTAVVDTIAAEDMEAVSSWAAALLLDQLAGFASGNTDSTIQADNVDHGSQAGGYARRAGSLRKRYYDSLGIDPKRNVAAGAVTDLDMTASDGGGRLFHTRFRR